MFQKRLLKRKETIPEPFENKREVFRNVAWNIKVNGKNKGKNSELLLTPALKIKGKCTECF